MLQTAVQNGLATLLQAITRDPEGSGRASMPTAWASAKGLVRSENQDRLIVARSSDLVFAVLADGMGGMRDGARAAAVAASATASWCMFSSQESALDARLHHALTFANDEVFKELRGDGGAAVVAAARRDDVWWIAHAGDARVYHLHASDVEQLTTDDTVRGQLGHLIGHARNEQFETGLLQFIGVGRDLEPHVRNVPSGGRALVLTSDGVHSLPPAIFEWVAKHAKALQAAVERFVQASEWHGGQDNATALALGLANGYGEGRQAAVEFWVPGEHLVVLAPSASVETPRTLPRGAPAAAVPAPSLGVTQERREPTAPTAPDSKPARAPRTARSRRKRSKKIAGKKDRLMEAVRRDGDLPQLPIVTIDAGPAEDASDKDERERRDSRSGGSVTSREVPGHKTR